MEFYLGWLFGILTSKAWIFCIGLCLGSLLGSMIMAIVAVGKAADEFSPR